MTKQELARRRNWMKFRLLGNNMFGVHNIGHLITSEIILAAEINARIKLMLERWDEESESLGLNTNTGRHKKFFDE